VTHYRRFEVIQLETAPRRVVPAPREVVPWRYQECIFARSVVFTSPAPMASVVTEPESPRRLRAFRRKHFEPVSLTFSPRNGFLDDHAWLVPQNVSRTVCSCRHLLAR